MSVNIDNFIELSKSIKLILNNEVKTKNEKIKIKIDKKYLFISLKSKLIFVNISLLIKTFLDSINLKQ